MKLFGGAGRFAKRNDLQPKEKNRKIALPLKILLIVLSILFVLVAAAVVYELFFVVPPEVPAAGLPESGAEGKPAESSAVAGEAHSGTDRIYTILLVGTDGDQTRTDTMILTFLNIDRNTLSLVSIPRDTYIKSKLFVPKLNSVYGANGCGKPGMEALMREVQKIVGFMPAGYLLVNLNAFSELVDIAGGVYFDVPERMYYSDPTQNLHIDLPAGYQYLDGEKAEQLVRFRSYKNGQADIERTKTQQGFLKAVAKQCITSANFSKISEYCSLISKNVTTNFTVGNLVYFAQEIYKCDLDQIDSYTLEGTAVWIGDGSYYKLNQSSVQNLMNRIIKGEAES